jgi:hypothetical protein
MNLISIDDFLDDVMPELPGCTEFLAIDKLRFAAIEFCRKTLVSQETVDELDLDAGEPELTIPTPNSSVRVYKIMWIKSPHRTLVAAPKQPLTDRSRNWDTIGEADWPISYVRLTNDTVQLIPPPLVDKSAVITAHVACIPTKSASRLDEVLIDEYREAIAAGALSRLLNMAKEPWFDREAAKRNAFDFASEISNARATVNKDGLMADTRVQFNKF